MSSELRQKLLVLYTGNSTPASPVVAWSLWDGTGKPGAAPAPEANPQPPYQTVIDAMKDGWRVINFPPLQPPMVGREYEVDYFKFEFVLEKLEAAHG
jgi:hypothetical protein